MLEAVAEPTCSGTLRGLEDMYLAVPHIVSDVMTAPAVAVGRDARFKEIVRVMYGRRVSAVPVVSEPLSSCAGG
ncbi:hypothetical protein KUM39_25470 [Streptomyces sp. J2-1]|nr:CBS domain-containing protein [Streptomyces corallincola]MBV2357664.1 hypothetical protein [Streptomyces corallincola]